MNSATILAGRQWRWHAMLLLACCLYGVPSDGSDEPVRNYRIAMVALTEDPEVRREFEDGLVSKAKAFKYDAVTSYDIVPEVTELENRDVVSRLSEAGVQSIVMMKPAAVGPGSTLESVKDEVSNEVYANIRSFAREIIVANMNKARPANRQYLGLPPLREPTGR